MSQISSLQPGHPAAVDASNAMPSGMAIAGGLAAAALLGLAVVAQPVIVFGGVIVMTLLVALVGGGAHLRSPYLAAFAVVLAGYAYFGRVFSYLGYPPIFVGEVFLAIGLLIALGCGAWHRLARAPLAWAMAAFVLWGAVRTFPFVPVYGIDALRDGALWGYAGFAVVIAVCLRRADLGRVLHGYRRVLLFMPAVVIGLAGLSRALGAAAPTLPWAPEVSLTTLKLGDAGVHLGGAAAFVLLGLGAPRSRAGRMLWWACWLAALGIVASSSRGGFLSVMAAAGCAAMAGGAPARASVARLAGAAALVGLIALTYPSSTELGADAEAGARQVSPRQMLANITSIAGNIGYGESGGGFVNLDETKAWRLQWWSDIVAYTFGGDYFWQGKGYGINLADDDGYQVMPELPLRSPHNVHLTVLARSGVPGVLLWIVVTLTLMTAVWRGRSRALAAGQDRWARLHAWVFAYLAAVMVNATFDVYLEGPAGGIWFWALAGFAIAALELQRSQASGAPGGKE